MCGNFTDELDCSEKLRIADEWIFKPSGGLVVVNVLSLWYDCRIFKLADFSLSFFSPTRAAYKMSHWFRRNRDLFAFFICLVHFNDHVPFQPKKKKRSHTELLNKPL